MKVLDKEFYGDNARWFVGIVTDNLDPKELGRVKVRIHGVHSPNTEEVPFESLPWAYAMLPTTEGGTSGIGKIPQLLPGARVFGIFMDGETSQLPLILGSLPKVEIPSQVQLKTNQSNPTASTNNIQQNIARDGTVSPDVPINQRKGTSFDVDVRRSQGVKFFIDNGYNIQQAAAIMGNLEHESNLNTEIPSSFPGEDSQGIAQWNPAAGRLQALKDFAANQLSFPRDWRDYDVQLQFVLHELRSSEKRANGKLLKASSIDGGYNNLDNATWVFAKYYERPSSNPELFRLEKRETLALKAYDQHVERA